MPTHITLRMQFGPHQDAQEVGRWLVDLVRTARPEEIMFFYFAEEQNDGHDSIARIQKWIGHSRVYRNRVAAEGVKISLNPWHTLLHSERGRRMKPGQDWQNLVGQDGRVSPVCLCPLDPNWREYFDTTLRMYAEEDFRVIWIDDDIRLHNHTPTQWACFCPLHVAEFNRRTGLNATREEIVRNCTAPGAPHPWRNQWLDMWDDTQLELIERWRQIVEAKGKQLGLMTSCLEYHAAEGRRWDKWWKAVGGNKPPFVRPYFWGYDEMPSRAFCQAIAILDQNRLVQPPHVENGPEVECSTYGRWNKSFRHVHAQMAAGLMQGATHLNVSLFDPMGNRPDDEPQRKIFLQRSRATMDWLADLFPMGLRTVGIGCPISEDMGRRIRTERGGDWQELVCPLDGWYSWLGAAGQAFSRYPSEHVNALDGPATWAFDDADLRRWLAHGLLLDGTAANILIQRGFGPLIGLRGGRYITQNEVPYSIEHALDGDFAVRKDADITANRGPVAPRLFQAKLLSGARMVTEIRSGTHQPLGHGLVIFENELGGRVATFPWEAHRGAPMIAQRAAQLAKLSAWLDPQNTRGWIENEAWVVPQFLTDGKTRRGVIWNVNPDAVETPIRVHLPQGMPEPKQVIQVDAMSNRFDASWRNGLLTPARPIHQWEFVVLAS